MLAFPPTARSYCKLALALHANPLFRQYWRSLRQNAGLGSGPPSPQLPLEDGNCVESDILCSIRVLARTWVGMGASKGHQGFARFLGFRLGPGTYLLTKPRGNPIEGIVLDCNSCKPLTKFAPCRTSWFYTNKVPRLLLQLLLKGCSHG